MILITTLNDERLGSDTLHKVCPCGLCLLEASLRAALEWKAAADTMIVALNNRIKEVENQFTEYAHDSQIKRDAALVEWDRLSLDNFTLSQTVIARIAERDAALADLKLNAALLAKQTDLAREAENQRDAALSRAEEERKRREYYQHIVYDVCSVLDAINDKRPGVGVCCGNLDAPCTEVQGAMRELKTQFAEHTRWVLLNAVDKHALQEAERRLCAAREIVNNNAFPCAVCEQITDALSSSSPCRHEARVAALEKVAEAARHGHSSRHDTGAAIENCPLCQALRSLDKEG